MVALAARLCATWLRAAFVAHLTLPIPATSILQVMVKANFLCVLAAPGGFAQEFAGHAILAFTPTFAFGLAL